MVELDKVAEGVREHLDHPISRWDPMVELVEVAEGVREHLDHPVSH